MSPVCMCCFPWHFIMQSCSHHFHVIGSVYCYKHWRSVMHVDIIALLYLFLVVRQRVCRSGYCIFMLISYFLGGSHFHRLGLLSIIHSQQFLGSCMPASLAFFLVTVVAFGETTFCQIGDNLALRTHFSPEPQTEDYRSQANCTCQQRPRLLYDITLHLHFH